MPLISIITINLNNKIGLKKTIESVIRQDYDKYEFIVIDGGSTDGSVEIIKQNAFKINDWISEPDNGVYNAMNKGIKKANGEYCLFVNSGDILYNEKVLTDIMNQELTSDIITGNTIVDDKSKNLQPVNAPAKISFYTFFKHTILHQATLIRTSLFKELGYYNENLRIVADWEFFLKALILHNCSYQSINVTFSVFDSTGISSRPQNFNVSLKERDDILQKYFPYFLADYQLLQPHSTFIFLQNIQKNIFLRNGFIFTSRLINKLFKIVSR
jgi:glycosyltransferase involved in cell wall biosynthesis